MTVELFRALAVLAEPPREETVRVAEVLELGDRPRADAYTELFLMQLYPYASVYLGAEGMLGGEARDRVAGFWRALGETPPAEPDHLASLLALYARLAEHETSRPPGRRRDAYRRARTALVWEHLLSWVPWYLIKLEELAPPVYGAWGRLVGAALHDVARELSLPAGLPLHLREAPALDVPSATGAEAFFQQLLVPVRSGVILTRTDLARCAEELGLGLRAGERRFALRALLGQDAPGVVAWLRSEAHGWGARCVAGDDRFALITRFWRNRAHAAAEALGTAGRLVVEAGSSEGP